MRRARTILAAAALALAATAGRAAAQGITAAPGGQLSSLSGMPFDVPVVVDMSARPDRLGAFAARLTWDPSRLRLDATSAGTFGSVTVSPDSLPQGIVRIAGANPAGAAGVVSLSVLRFTPLLPDTATLSLAFSELFAAQTFNNLLPSLTVSGRQFCPARGRFGDMDADGTAGSRDALIALSAAVGINVAPHDTLLGDVDGNQSVNARDALGILTHAVGLPTPTFRVLALALGSCAIGGPVTLQLSPGVTGPLVITQQIAFEARASDGTGALQAVQDAVWRSSDPNVLAVGPSGVASARAAGTAVITATRAGQDSASISVTVVTRRSRHVVDAAALQSANATGSAALPYGLLRDAILAAQDGDTVQLRPGRYAPALAAITIPRLVLLGDTLPSGQRPTIFGDGSQANGFGLSIVGAQDIAIVDVGFDALTGAVSVQGAGRLRFTGVHGTALGSLVLSSGPIGHFRVERSKVVGDPTSFLSAIELFGPVDTAVIVDSDISDFGQNVMTAFDVDSVAVIRSRLNRFGGEGFQLDEIEARGRGLAMVIDSSQLRRFGSEIIDASEVRSLVARWSTLESEQDLFRIFSTNPTGYVKLHRDSLISLDNEAWIDVEGLDSVVVDSLHVSGNEGYGWFYNIGLIRVTRSVFDGVDYMIEAGLGASSANRTGGRIEVRNVQVTGSPTCDRCGYGLEVFGDYRVIVDSSAFTNLDAGIEYNADSNVTVTHSLFRHTWAAIDYEGNYSVGCPSCGGNPNALLTVQFNTIEDAEDGVLHSDGLLLMDSNTVRDIGDEAVSADSYASLIITRNRITNVGEGIEADLSDSSGVMRIEDNVLTGVEFTGMDLSGDSFRDTLAIRIDVLRNTVACNGYQFSDGIQISYADARVTDNVVTGCGLGLALDAFTSTVLKTDTILRNRIVLPPNATGGLLVQGDLRSVIIGNHVSGPASAGSSWGMIDVDGGSLAGRGARIERDTVQGGQRYGIQVNDLDTTLVAFNVVNDMATSTFGEAGIVVAGSHNGDTVRVRGNAIRRASGDGVFLTNFGSATVVLDSNLVSKSGAAGVRISSGDMRLRRNTIDTSGQHGVAMTGFNGGSVVLDSNNLLGNRYGLTNQSPSTVTAVNNWWGSIAGPSCVSACAPAAGDSIDDVISHTPFLTAPVAGAPIVTVPPAFRPVASLFSAPPAPGAAPVRSEAPRPVRARRASTPEARPDVSRLPAAAGRERLAMHDAQVTRDAERERRRAARLQARELDRQRDAEQDRIREAAAESRRARHRSAGSRP